jgi:hypothetical protein
MAVPAAAAARFQEVFVSHFTTGFIVMTLALEIVEQKVYHRVLFLNRFEW